MMASTARALRPYGLLHSWNRWRRRRAARRVDLGAPPERVVLVLCAPRSGSTWLFDALRCHPAIELHPRYTVFARLGCVGRRYPLDLAGTAADPAVEVDLGRWASVPPFTCAAGGIPPAVLAQPFAIEKIHPHFFSHDEEAFLARLAALEERARVEVIYLTRAPEASLRSFLSYQRRNPKWNARIRPARAPRHMRQTYEALLRIATRRPGVMVDYDDLVERFASTIALILARLWPGTGPASCALLDAIATATARERRVAGAPMFLDRPSSSAAPLALRAEAEDELGRCRRAYDGLRALGASEPGR